MGVLKMWFLDQQYLVSNVKFWPYSKHTESETLGWGPAISALSILLEILMNVQFCFITPGKLVD